MEQSKRYLETPDYFINPMHPITVLVVGAGGSGSHLVEHLANLNYTMKQLDHPGLHVTVMDDDIVQKHNIGRQAFTLQDIGKNKAVALVTRLNRNFGTDWIGIPKKFSITKSRHNVVFGCVDSILSRKMISKWFHHKKHEWNENITYLYIDLGNGKDTGQIIIGKKDSRYGDFFEHFPNVKDEKTKETCSMAEALTKQDLNINRLMALHASNLFWKMFRKGKLDCCGMYINASNNQIAEIPT
jgi:PRTRC genetic system ThiF family protein